MSAALGTFSIIARLLKSGTPTASKTDADNAIVGYTGHDMGGALDTWGVHWTPTEINSGLAFDIQFELGTGAAATPNGLDAVGVTVYYTMPDGSQRSASIGIGIRI